VQNKFCRGVLEQLDDSFTMTELRRVLPAQRKNAEPSDAGADRAARGILLLAESNYEVRFAEGQPVSQRVIFPSTPSQSNGIEDARFVRFQNDDGGFTYYATYTAYDGKIILPQLLETEDFLHFKFITLNGPAVQNKGMALFPRKIDGRYAMISRQDDENILIMFSDNIHFSGLAGAQPRRRRHAQVLHRGVPARLERPRARDRAAARTAPRAERSRARGLRAERRLHLRRAAAPP
jgi:hypothetical protein